MNDWESFKRYVKWIIIIFVLILIVIGIIALIYRMGHKKTLGIAPVKSPLVLTQNADSPVLAAGDKKIYYFDTALKTLRQVDLQTKKITDLYAQKYTGAYLVSWSPDRSKVIISQSERSGTSDNYNYQKQTFLIDLGTKSEKELSFPLDNIAWSPDSQRVIYSWPADVNLDQSNISLSGPDGTNTQIIKTLLTKGAPLKIVWTSMDEILIFKSYFNPPESYDLTDADKNAVFYHYNLKTKAIDSINKPTMADFSASSDGQKIFYINDTDANSLNLLDSQGEHAFNNLPFTSFDSTVWSTDNQMFYNIASNLNSDNSTTLTVDRLDLKNYQTSDIYDLLLDNNVKNDLYFADHVLLTNDQKKIFFTADFSLYELDL